MNADVMWVVLLLVALLVLAPMGHGRRVVVVVPAEQEGCLAPLGMIAGILILLWVVI